MKCPVLVYYESDGMYWLHDLGVTDAPYLPEDKFRQLVSGTSTDEQEKGYLGYWCIVTHPHQTPLPRATANENNQGSSQHHIGITEYDDKTKQWNQAFRDVIKFKERTGHLNPKHVDDPILYKWMTMQRYLLRDQSPRMTVEKKKCLDSIGFDWKYYDMDCNDFDASKSEGDGMDTTASVGEKEPPPPPPPPPPLPQQQEEAKEEVKTPGIEAKDDSDAKWNGKFHQLCLFKARHGHLRPGSNDSLYKWSNRQRYACRDNLPTMTIEKKEILESIGFDFQGFDANWKGGANDDNATDAAPFDGADGKFAVKANGGKGDEEPKPMEVDAADNGTEETKEDSA